MNSIAALKDVELDISIAISAFALLVSGLALWISWKTYARDRSKIKIEPDYHPQTGRGTQFSLRAVNHGRRVANIELCRLNFRDQEPLGDSTAGGIQLEEGDVYDWWFPIYGPEGPLRDPTQLQSVEVFDTVGNRYAYPGLSVKNLIIFRKLKRRIRNHWVNRDHNNR